LSRFGSLSDGYCVILKRLQRRIAIGKKKLILRDFGMPVVNNHTVIGQLVVQGTGATFGKYLTGDIFEICGRCEAEDLLKQGAQLW